jgi:hypothetical protein
MKIITSVVAALFLASAASGEEPAVGPATVCR